MNTDQCTYPTYTYPTYTYPTYSIITTPTQSVEDARKALRDAERRERAARKAAKARQRRADEKARHRKLALAALREVAEHGHDDARIVAARELLKWEDKH